MEVIFLQDVLNVANAGDRRKVANGFARNYLIPKKLAVLASPEALKRTERIKEAGRQHRIRETEQWDTLAQELDGAVITVTGKVSPTGRFYGSISPAQIAEALHGITGREIDRKLVEVLEPIREPGDFEVSLNLAPNVTATINISAQAEQQAPK